MLLDQYPQAIATLQRQQLKQEQQVRRFKAILVTLDRELDAAIAYDLELKNDTQRKARRAELQALEDYQGALLDLQNAQDRLIELEIDLTLLRSQFSVLKLEKRGAIAQLEAAIAV
ncbi:MAG: hypothetical protein HC772_18045 [Leptolyngbyaceae cyanobacterium CRU_2_3]|jgi:hypothetical protein|nr:hypothetical protein [Leptolyngbyaceae cyanobacterium CRU_2_3]